MNLSLEQELVGKACLCSTQCQVESLTVGRESPSTLLASWYYLPGSAAETRDGASILSHVNPLILHQLPLSRVTAFQGQSMVTQRAREMLYSFFFFFFLTLLWKSEYCVHSSLFIRSKSLKSIETQPHSRQWELNSTSWWEEGQRICGYSFKLSEHQTRDARNKC